MDPWTPDHLVAALLAVGTILALTAALIRQTGRLRLSREAAQERARVWQERLAKRDAAIERLEARLRLLQPDRMTNRLGQRGSVAADRLLGSIVLVGGLAGACWLLESFGAVL